MFMRLCVTLGLGFTTAIYSSAEEQDTTNDIMTPYNRAFYLCMAFAGASVLMCPWMRIDAQGGKAKRMKER